MAARAGLADEWDAVKEAYAAANRALGNIVKVTPSSKVVGDLANFMVANKLDDASLVERAPDLSFPNSVVQFMQGYLGQPPGGFPEPLRSRIMKDAQPIEGRPGASLPPLNMVSLKADLRVRPPHAASCHVLRTTVPERRTLSRAPRNAARPLGRGAARSATAAPRMVAC